MHLQTLIRLEIACYLLFALSGSVRAAQPVDVQPPNWASNLRFQEAPDTNPDPNIVEVQLEARVAAVDIAGKATEMWTYNGGIPGPLIRANVGDRVIVHFTNNLPDPTTVHWHGVRVPIEMDGVPDISQPEVSPGESFTYDFIVPDAGLFWYHPHVQSAKQVGFGLSGPLLVEDPSDRIAVSDQLVLVLNDFDIDDSGALASPDSGGSAGMAFGREGNIVLVNGKQNAAISGRTGAPQRWRVVNTAKSRYFDIDLRGQATITKIGGDGGLQEYPTKVDFIVLAPGERADLIVTPKAKAGREIQVYSELFNRGFGSIENRLPENLFRIAISNMPPYTAATPLPKILRAIEPLKLEGAVPVEITIDMIQDRKQNNQYRINQKPFWLATPIEAKIGETQLWTIRNNSDWSHPMHLHGFFFQVLDDKGQAVRPLEWKDTVDVPLRKTVKLLVRFDDRPGTWMVHCHILDHAEGGLMTTVHLGDGPVLQHLPHP